MSPEGTPIEEFLINPPIDCEKNGIKFSRDYTSFEKDGIVHLIDWIGEKYYESPWDFYEECNAKGMSRRVRKGYDFSKLTIGKSHIFFVHKKAIDLDAKEKKNLIAKNRFAPTFIQRNDFLHGQWGKRQVGDIYYEIDQHKPDEPLNTAPGIFFHLPIRKLTYVRPSDERELKRIQDLGIDINIAEE